MKARSSSVMPPQIPCACRVRSANVRHWRRTGQRAQIAFASATCSSAWPKAEIGKNNSGLADRQAAADRQSRSEAVVSSLIFACCHFRTGVRLFQFTAPATQTKGAVACRGIASHCANACGFGTGGQQRIEPAYATRANAAFPGGG